MRHQCGVGDDSLHIVGVWESEEAMRTRFASQQMHDALTRAGFRAMDRAEITVIRMHAVELRATLDIARRVTGRAISFETGTFWLIGPDGLITEERSYFDAAGVAAQLGIPS